MKKYLIAVVLLTTVLTVNAHAMILPIDWTGNEVIAINDFPTLASNFGQNLGLGGPVNNQAVLYKAFEFTVAEHSIIDYLFVDATVVPDNNANPTDPNFFSPQSMDVTFKLYKGTRLFGSGHDLPAPDSLVFTSNTYNFSSTDSHTNRDYSDFQIPFKTGIASNDTYWLWAGASGGPATFNYSTKLEGNVAPEPATILLLSTGLLGAFVKRRKQQ